MNAPPATPQPVQEISITRLSTAIFSVLALMFSLGALIVAADNNDGGTTSQAGSVKTSAGLEASANPATAIAVSMKEFSFDP